MLLLNPGPVTLSERVRRSLLNPDLCHRESEFFDLQDEARSRLLSTYDLDPARWAAVLLTASGTAAVESMVAALVPQNGRLLVVENGVYGERISLICTHYGIAHERIIGDWMRAPDYPAIAAKLVSAPEAARFTHVAVVHHETTTGRLNDLGELLALCVKHGAALLVDGVSSFGAEAIDFENPALSAVAATANKCLHGVPGAAFVIVRRSELVNAISRTYYLDLLRLARLQDERNTPFTPAVHAYYALVEALREYAEQGGRRARYQRYAELAERARAGLAALGIDSAISPKDSSVVLRAYTLPVGMDYPRLHDALKADGFVIYAGQGNLSKDLFRISTMGALAAADIDRLLHSFARLLR
ncbi:MAG TPA: 2-aminoethylphosphonate aminotransferase [Steroidobacteraceae bacterium]|nr:2-aminoethylphosphonate aminotransferase [Steroidobacteraceae bacterium]